MKSINILNLYQDIVIEKKKLLLSFVLDEYDISRKTLYNYIGDINEIIRIRLSLEIKVKNNMIQIFKFE